MRLGCRLLLTSLVATLCYAQLTIDQKVSDFQALAALYAKRYGPYEWKRDALGIDLFSIAPWLAQGAGHQERSGLLRSHAAVRGQPERRS